LIQLALDRVAQNRTTITIAHRLSTIRKADHIVVFQRGQAIEQGTHQDLSADSESAYSKLIRAQSLHIFTTDGVENDLSLTENASESEKLLSTVLEVAGLERSSISQEAMITKNYPLGQSFKILLQKQRKQWLSFLVILLSAMAAAAAIPIQAWLFAKALGVFLADKDHMKKEADFWGLMWFVLAASYALASFCEFWLSLRVQYAVSATCKIQYFTDMLQQRLSYFDEENHSHGTLTSLIASDAKLLEELFGINLAVALTGIFNVVGCIIIALVFSWKLGLVAMFLTMPIMLSSGFWKYRQEVQFDQMDSKVFAESSQFATEAIGAIRTVSALTMEGSIIERYSTLLCGHVQVAQRKALWTAGLFGFVDSAGLGCQALIFWYGGQLLIKGEFSYEAFFVCYMAMIQGAEAASQILSIAPNSAQAASAANRIFALEDSAKVELAQKHNDKDLSETEGGVLIELRDVSFKYPTRDVIVFQNLNLTIEKGQYAAIVGPSGCGKTTIISLLERFYDLGPDQGTISCNGININDLDVNRYRRNLSLVAQEPTMFQGTVRDNILFGMPNPDSVSDEKIQKVCRDALIHDFITSLPDGYQTDVGQKGVAMSGGQKQRIAIARALIRNPKILLLDEATSALDSESEQIVQAAFERARAGRTMIAVAHRLSTIQNADVIFVFDDGRIVEKGSHVELVRKRGVYWDMVCFFFVPFFLPCCCCVMLMSWCV
jgi:ATP-binding cassette subfamily B (MDR/TAP) protein 1